MNPRRQKGMIPQPGGEAFHHGEAGPLNYTYPMPPAKSRGRLIPAGEWQVGEAGPALSPEEANALRRVDGVLDPCRPLIPTAEEVAKLPRSARFAFAERCAARVARLTPPDQQPPPRLEPPAAAALIVAAARYNTPLARQLRCIRRDFDRLLRLAREHNWTDDTPVPAEAFGPMWPTGLVPEWAQVFGR